MLNVFKNIPKTNKLRFSMPLSLEIIKECAEYKIDYKGLHIADLFSIIYSIRIDNANRYLEQQKQEKLNRRGISNIQQANQDDFDRL